MCQLCVCVCMCIMCVWARAPSTYDAPKNIMVTEKHFLSFLLRNIKKAVVIRMPLEIVWDVIYSIIPTVRSIIAVENYFILCLDSRTLLPESSPWCPIISFLLFGETKIFAKMHAATNDRKTIFFSNKKKKKEKIYLKNSLLQCNKNFTVY